MLFSTLAVALLVEFLTFGIISDRFMHLVYRTELYFNLFNNATKSLAVYSVKFDSLIGCERAQEDISTRAIQFYYDSSIMLPDLRRTVLSSNPRPDLNDSSSEILSVNSMLEVKKGQLLCIKISQNNKSVLIFNDNLTIYIGKEKIILSDPSPLAFHIKAPVSDIEKCLTIHLVRAAHGYHKNNCKYGALKKDRIECERCPGSFCCKSTVDTIDTIHPKTVMVKGINFHLDHGQVKPSARSHGIETAEKILKLTPRSQSTITQRGEPTGNYVKNSTKSLILQKFIPRSGSRVAEVTQASKNGGIGFAQVLKSMGIGLMGVSFGFIYWL